MHRTLMLGPVQQCVCLIFSSVCVFAVEANHEMHSHLPNHLA